MTTKEKHDSHALTASGGKSSVTVRVPGSTSNLGPGFDTLGLALSIYNTFCVEVDAEAKASGPSFEITGPYGKGLPKDQTNLVYTLLLQRLKDKAHILERAHIKIDSCIPLAGGLGSSGTATVAACWIAQALRTGHPQRERVLNQATEIEGHPDNVAPSLLGGFVISGTSANKRKVFTQKLTWPSAWQTIFILPQYELSTKHARSVLPKRVPHADAVHNVQRVSLLIGAIANEDEEAFKHAMQDRLHEPYRQELVPELTALRKVLPGWPVIGCALSGAGPSIMLVCHRRYHGQVLDELKAWTGKLATVPKILDLKVDEEGLRQIDD